ncbi:MAG TPA: FAD-dependent oxidoreductase [Nocardioides sp.]|uniref:NAD(P)/FAD-dependent oxidoreductase n=1 Tax=Nocardioides sp. TaxID=35761 RepID=UPI002E357753|nr:FAD-dependent oxidoreductase [Nocardioides sp.]HEX5088514.1 FAD-dependent oxidoreductase [Nocardioides sp.]
MAEGPDSVVIVGGGLAGAKTAEALREQGYTGSVTLLAAEDELPYERPPLSKGYLMGKDEFDKAVVHPEEWYAEHDVDLRRGVRATAIDRAAHEVELDDGSRLPYGALVLATGSEPRALPVPGAEPLTLRTHADSDRIKATFGAGKRLAVIGGGWIGLEVAAAAREAGTDVTLVEAAAQPLLGVLGPEMGSVFADLHREHGVDLRLGSTDLSGLEADAVVVGVGVRPRTELAEAAGLDVDNGVLVDASLRTSDPDVYAVGDIANHDHPVLGRRVRVEHWANALNQPATAAAAILGGSAAYDRLPYFFSDQYDLGMEYVGHATRDDTARVVTRGEVEKREFVAFWLDDQDRILAAMNVNVWDVPDEVRPLIVNRTVVDVDRLSDPDTPLADVGR